MDVSTLFAAPNTAASATALSFGALAGNGGNATTAGGGLEGLDSFNQLLGNFLSVTGGEASGMVVEADGNAAEGASVTPSLPQGTVALMGAGLLKGAGLGSTSGTQPLNGRSVEGRWAQSGLNLLAGGGLAGQEMNQEVISFLNDLSQAITAQGESPIRTPQEFPGGAVVESDVTEMLVVLKGESAPLTSASPVITPAVISPFGGGSNNSMQVIPKSDMTSASGQLGVTLTVEGTGLTSLSTAMVVEDTRLPVASPVIPRALPTAQPAASVTSRAAVAPTLAPPVPTPLAHVAVTPGIQAMDEGKIAADAVAAIATPTDVDAGEDAPAPATIGGSAPLQVPPADVLPTQIAAQATPAPAILPTPDVRPLDVDGPVVAAATDIPPPVEAAPAMAVPVPTDATVQTRTITGTTATATTTPTHQAAAIDAADRAKDGSGPAMATGNGTATAQTLAAATLAEGGSSLPPVMPADLAMAGSTSVATPAIPVDADMAKQPMGAANSPNTPIAAPASAAITDDPVPAQNPATPTANPADKSAQPTAAPAVAVTMAPVEPSGMPAAQNLTAPAVLLGTAANVPDASAVEQVDSEQAAPAVANQPAANGQGRVTMAPAEAPPPPTIPAQNLDTAQANPSRPMPPVVTATSADTDRIAALFVPIELVTQAAADVPTTPVIAMAATPVETKQASSQAAPKVPPSATPDKAISATTVAAPVPAPQSMMVADMPDGGAANDAPAPTPAPVTADMRSIDQAAAAAQDAAPTAAPIARVVIEPAPKAAAVKPMMTVAASSSTPTLGTAETVDSESLPVIADDDAATPSVSATPTTTVPGTARVTVTISRTATQTAQNTQPQLAPTDQPGDGQALSDAAEEDVDATNQKMLAPKHMGEESRLAEAQSDLGNPAQSAGQNNPAARQDAVGMRAIGGADDNLLAHAVSATGKGHESNAGGEGESGADPEHSAQTPDSLTNPTSGGETVKAQSSDFAQSLRQTATPHRASAYMPPTHQMAMQVQRAIQDGNERLSIRLNPQELGRIDVQLEIGSEGKLRAKVMVENPQTLEMLQKDAKSLEKALQDAGLQTDQDSLSFSLQDNGDQTQQRRDQSGQSGHGTAIASDTGELEDPAILAQTQILELGRVDVVV